MQTRAQVIKLRLYQETGGDFGTVLVTYEKKKNLFL